jgi:hypothetical protein
MLCRRIELDSEALRRQLGRSRRRQVRQRIEVKT